MTDKAVDAADDDAI